MTAPARRRRGLGLGLGLGLGAVLALAPTSVRADRLRGTRGGEAMREQANAIELRFERGYATMTVQRRVDNGDHEHDEAVLAIDLPAGAVATGLRTRGRGRWVAGELLDADLAAARYTELTSLGVHEPRDLALLAWGGLGSLCLRVFPIAPGADAHLEYSVDMPATWRDGRWLLELDELGLADQPARLRVTATERGDHLFVDGAAVRSGHELALDGVHELELAPRRREQVLVELAVAATGQARAVVHWRLALDAELSTLPRHARIVVGLDLSRSMSEAEIEAQRLAAMAYLGHFVDPQLDAAVAVIGFDHELRMLTPGLVSAAEAVATLGAASLERRNGSELGLALQAATTLLSGVSPRSAKRVVLMTDFELASRIVAADYEALAADSGAIIHLAQVTDAAPGLRRDDGHDWSGVAVGTGGVLWRATAPAALAVDDSLAAEATFEEWARPLRLDNLVVELDGVVQRDPEQPASLAEGDGHDELRILDGAPRHLRIRASRWGAPVSYEARSRPALERRWSALVFGHDAHAVLDEDEMRTLARRGGAVSPVTSYLAIEPGARPSTVGLDLDTAGRFGKGGGGGTGSRRGYSWGVAFSGRLDRQAWLEDQFAGAWDRCGGGGIDGSITIETTFDELVDVQIQTSIPADPGLVRCVEAFAWGLTLPADDFIDGRQRWVVAP